MTAPTGPVFSVRDIPFSYAGSWFCISPVVGEKTYAKWLHLVSHQTGLHAVLQLVPMDRGLEVDPPVSASPARLVWAAEPGRVELAYETADTVRVRGHGLGLTIRASLPTLTPFRGTYFYRDPVDGAHIFADYGTGRRYRVTLLAGSATATGEEVLGTGERGVTIDGDEPWEIAIEEFDSARPPYRSSLTFEIGRGRVGKECRSRWSPYH